MSYSLKYHKAVKNDLNSLEVSSKARIKRAIETRLAIDPIKFGEPLKGNLKGFKKLRVGDYKIVYKMRQEEVLILGIGHRKDIYAVIKNRENQY